MRKTGILVLCALAAGVQAQMRITEFASGGTITSGKGEYMEFTNVGSTSIDMTGWSFDDSSRVAGSFSISGFGVVAAHQSVILTEVSDTDFRTAFGLAASVKIVGLNDQNLGGGGDEINIYDSTSTLVDRLTYTSQASATISNNAPTAALGLNNYAAWVQSSVGDTWGSHVNITGDIGNPGVYTPVPEPASIFGLIAGVGAVIRRKRRAR